METAFNRPTGHAYIDWVGQVKNLLANDTIPPCKMVGMHTFREFAEEGRRRMRDASTVDPSVKSSIEKYGVGLTNFYKSFGMKNLEKPAGVEYKMKLPHHLSGSEGESEGEESLGESVSEPESDSLPGTSTAASFIWRTQGDGYDSALESSLSKALGALGTKKAARTIAKAKERRAAAAAREAKQTRTAVKKASNKSGRTTQGSSTESSTPLSFPKTKASKAVAQAMRQAPQLFTGGGGGGGNSSGGGSKKGSGSSSSGKKRGRPMKIEGRIVTIENPFTGSRQSIQNKQ